MHPTIVSFKERLEALDKLELQTDSLHKMYKSLKDDEVVRDFTRLLVEMYMGDNDKLV
jgi:hypothetical protein